MIISWLRDLQMNKKLFICMILLFCLFFIIRLINIDADLPPWGIINYQPVDEGIYGNMALNMINFGSINPNNYYGFDAYLMQGHVITNIIGNLVTYICLMIFGDNYFGFRLSYIIFVFFSCLIMLLAWYKIKKSKNIIIMAIVLLCSFQLYVSSRVIEPSVVRLFFISTILFLMSIKSLDKRVLGFLVGLCITISCFMVYITNVFLYLTVFLFLIYQLKSKKYQEVKILFMFGCIGIIIGLIISQLYYGFIWNTDLITNTIAQINSFQYDQTYAVNYINIQVYVNRLIKFLTSNLFLYTLPLLSFVLLNFKTVIKNIKDKDIMVFCCLGLLSFMIQTLFSEDYVVRKSLIIAPFYFTLIYYCLINRNYNLEISFITNLVSIILSIFIPIFRLYLINDSTNLDFNQNDKILIFILMISAVAMPLLIYRNKKQLIIVAFLFFTIVNITYIYRYCFKNVTFYEKDCMVALSKYNDQIILGEYINGFTLYNDVKPLLNTQDKYNEYLQANKSILYFDYYDIDDVIKDRFQVNDIEKVFEVKRNFLALGSKRNMGIYRLECNDEN